MFDTHIPPCDDSQNPTANDQNPPQDELQDMMQTFTPNQDEEIAALKAQVAQLTDSLARSQAEFINFRKRQALEQESFSKFANQKLILDLLPIVDNFQRAFQHVPAHIKDEQWVIGALAIEKQFVQLLDKLGVQKINTIGQMFDANLHEILTTGEQENTAKDMVIEEFEAGYMLGDKVLRPAKVKVQK